MTLDLPRLRTLAAAAQNELPCDIPYTARQFSDWQPAYREYIAAACNAVPVLCDEVERLEIAQGIEAAAVEALRRQVNHEACRADKAAHARDESERQYQKVITDLLATIAELDAANARVAELLTIAKQAVVLYEIQWEHEKEQGDEQGANFWLSHLDTTRSILHSARNAEHEEACLEVAHAALASGAR